MRLTRLAHVTQQSWLEKQLNYFLVVHHHEICNKGESASIL